jgi:WD40 repeat protein
MIASYGPGKRPALRVRDVRTREPIGRPLVGPRLPGDKHRFQPRRESACVRQRQRRSVALGRTRPAERRRPGGDGAIHALAHSPDGSTIAVAGSRGVARWKARTRAQVEQISDGGHTDIAFSPDGDTLASGAERGLDVWIRGRRKPVVFESESADAPYGVAFSPDGKTLAAGYFMAVELWNLENRKRIEVVHGPKAAVGSLAFNPAATLAWSASGETVSLCESAGGAGPGLQPLSALEPFLSRAPNASAPRANLPRNRSGAAG